MGFYLPIYHCAMQCFEGMGNYFSVCFSKIRNFCAISGPSIQVRRQDKYREAKFIPLETYVEHLEEYFDILKSKREVDHLVREIGYLLPCFR